jgi:hypothetical protein
MLEGWKKIMLQRSFELWYMGTNKCWKTIKEDGSIKGDFDWQITGPNSDIGDVLWTGYKDVYWVRPACDIF